MVHVGESFSIAWGRKETKVPGMRRVKSNGPPQAKAPQGTWGSGGLPPLFSILGQVLKQSEKKTGRSLIPRLHPPERSQQDTRLLAASYALSKSFFPLPFSFSPGAAEASTPPTI